MDLAPGIPPHLIGALIAISGLSSGMTMLVIKYFAGSARAALKDHQDAERVTMTAVRSALEETDEMIGGLTVRLSALEAAVASQPSMKDVHALALGVERLIARLDSQDRIISRLDAITQRQEDYLVSRSR